jgi:hypothetical protein
MCLNGTRSFLKKLRTWKMNDVAVYWMWRVIKMGKRWGLSCKHTVIQPCELRFNNRTLTRESKKNTWILKMHLAFAPWQHKGAKSNLSPPVFNWNIPIPTHKSCLARRFRFPKLKRSVQRFHIQPQNYIRGCCDTGKAQPIGVYFPMGSPLYRVSHRYNYFIYEVFVSN